MNLDFFKNKKILVAGGAGLLGTNLTQRLASENIEIYSSYFSRLPIKNLSDCYKQYDFTKYEDCLKATEGMDYVIICAVQAAGVAGVRKSPTGSLMPNLDIHAGLFEACAENKVEKAIWVSSSTVYQEAFYPIREDQLDLNQPTYELYQGIGQLYRYIEHLAKCYVDKRKLPVSVIRTSSIYGPYDRFDDQRSHVIPALIKRALKKEDPFHVWGGPDTVRDFVYVDDLTEATLEVLKSSCNGDPINFSNGTPINIGELVHSILHATNHEVSPIYDPSKPTAVPYRVLDNTKFNTILKNIKRTPLEEGLRKTIDWYQSSLGRD